MKHGKKYTAASATIDREKAYVVDDAVQLIKQSAKAKFDETVDLVVRLGVDPRHADQQVRGAVVLPHGIGKTVRVVVFLFTPKIYGPNLRHGTVFAVSCLFSFQPALLWAQAIFAGGTGSS